VRHLEKICFLHKEAPGAAQKRRDHTDTNVHMPVDRSTVRPRLGGRDYPVCWQFSTCVRENLVTGARFEII
jgi:hypothetical protein